jgi:nucleotide-binding universal stress UspA family protein
MKTLLIPVDFTPTSDNTIKFAVEWAKRYEYERIILLKTLYDSIFNSVALSEGYANVNKEYANQDREQTRARMNELCESLQAQTGLSVRTAVSEEPLLRAVMDIIRAERTDMIMLGSDNYTYSSGSMVANHVISIAKASPVRVMVVPSTYTYRPITNALVPVDFNTVDTLQKLHAYGASTLWSDMTLHVLNVDVKERYLTPDEEFKIAEANLHELLQHFKHELHYSNEKDPIKGIKNYLGENDVQLIIALPGRHSFLYSLTHKSISEAIYRNAKEPVLILK